MASELDLIGTIGDDDDVAVLSESSDSDIDEPVKTKKSQKSKKIKQDNIHKAAEFAADFEFDVQDDAFESWDLGDTIQQAKKKVHISTLDDKIAKVRRQNKQEEKGEDVVDVDEEEEEDWTSEDEDVKTDKIKVKEKRKKKKKKGEADDEPELVQFSSEVTHYDKKLGFSDMNLSRPLLKALSVLKFLQPTPIQAATIPISLMAKDICACAATGTGKTAAFMLPILERLIYKPKQAPVTKVLVLTPTRELAVQIYTVSKQLSQFTNVEVCLSAGGLDIRSQEAALRLGPDIVIATPGRLIDHLHNSPNFNLDSVEILVLDEADRMLDEYFAEQMKEVIRLCSRTRQTMLFSATMTEAVEDLAAVSLKNPVKVFVDQAKDVAFNLRQEFIRIRENREGDREAVVAALVKRTFHDHCMVFIQTKKQAHRMHILLGLLGIKVGELHGNLSQAQRLEALKNFKDGNLDVLLATDLAARGLDIHAVKTVINFTMPNTIEHYIHRVGRTARAGKSGRSVTLVGEKERKLLKEIVKRAKNPVKSRVVPQEVIGSFTRRLAGLEKDLVTIERQERDEKHLQAADNQLNKAQKIINGNMDEKRVWFQTHKERKKEQAGLRLGDRTKLPSNPKERKALLMKTQTQNAKDRVEFEVEKATAYAARASKRQQKEKRIRACADDDNPRPTKKRKFNKKSAFEKELTNVGGQAVRKLRAGPSYKERKEMGLSGKKGGKYKNKKR